MLNFEIEFYFIVCICSYPDCKDSQKSTAISTSEHIDNAQYKSMVKPVNREVAAAPGEFIALQTCNALKKLLLGYGAIFYKLLHRE